MNWITNSADGPHHTHWLAIWAKPHCVTGSARTNYRTIAHPASTEAELMAISITGKELMWWKRFFESIDFDTEEFPSIYRNNLQTIRFLTKDTLLLNTKLKHVNIHKAWLRQEVQKGTLEINWVASADMIADRLTKALPPQRHQVFMEQLGLKDTRTINRD